MTRYLFLGTFLATLMLQTAWWSTQGIYDAEIWGLQPQYMVTGNPEQFNAAAAYGHPGGPLIIATHIMGLLTDSDPTRSLMLALTLLTSLAIACIATLAYTIWGRWTWSLLLTTLFALHPLYLGSTPPSALAALLAVVFALLSYRLFLHKPTLKAVIVWGGAAGLLMATRADIGILLTVFLGTALLTRLTFMHIIAGALAATASFVALDPFMWTIPARHLFDLAFKGYYHFALIAPSALSLTTVLLLSLFALVSLVLCGSMVAGKDSRMPILFYGALVLLTVALYCILLSASYQTVRYFMPIVFIWEAFLPLALFSLIERLPQARQTWLRASAWTVLIAYPVAHFLARLP